MYDGKNLHYYFLLEGLWDEIEGAKVFNFHITYNVDEERLDMVSGTGMTVVHDFTCFREGSEEDKVQKALVAYYNYISNLDKYNEYQEYFSYKLVYVDDDDIPELVVMPCNGCIMCTYKDGEVIQLVNSSTSWLNYIEKCGDYQYGGMLAGEFCAKLEDGMGEVVAYRMSKRDEEGYFTGVYYVDDAEVSEEDYQDYLDSLPYDYVSATEDMYSSIYEAYENLN